MKVAIYARVSTDDKGQNPETQLLQLREFCQRAGWEVYREYVDQARARDYRHRMAWADLLRGAHQRRFQCVLVYKLDRAFRSVRDCCNQVEDWESKGIKFACSSQDIDTSSPMGRYFLHNLAAFAELESSLIGDRVTSGIRRVRAEGKPWGRKPLQLSSQSICETVAEEGSVGLAADRLSCSVAYIYKVLKPFGINPSKLAKGETKLAAALALVAAQVERLE